MNNNKKRTRRKFCHLQVNGWNWRTSSYVKLFRFRKPKAACFLPYVEYRLNTNISSVIYTYKYIQNVYLKVDLVEETKGRGK
jgi:hypothetical protein